MFRIFRHFFGYDINAFWLVRKPFSCNCFSDCGVLHSVGFPMRNLFFRSGPYNTCSVPRSWEVTQSYLPPPGSVLSTEVDRRAREVIRPELWPPRSLQRVLASQSCPLFFPGNAILGSWQMVGCKFLGGLCPTELVRWHFPGATSNCYILFISLS